MGDMTDDHELDARRREYQQLSQEILHCPDLDKAREISERLAKLRTEDPRCIEPPSEPYRGPTSRIVADMKPGEVAYTLPWGLFVYCEGGYAVAPDYPAAPTSGGYYTLKVTRLRDGFIVDVTAVSPTYTWTPRLPSENALPVVKVVGSVRID